MVISHPQPSFVIRDLETLKVVTDPLRNQILEAILAAPQTVKQIAEKLGVTPSKLYYHVNMLEEFGFIRVAETRMVANMVEKIYCATAAMIEVDRSLISFTTDSGKQAINDSALSILDTTRQDLLRSLRARSRQLDQGAPQRLRPALLSRDTSHIPDARVEEFQQRLQQLIADFKVADTSLDAPDSHSYALTILFYPSFYYEASQNEAASGKDAE